MPLPFEILKKQSEWQKVNTDGEADHSEKQVFLNVSVENSRYLIPIGDVSEVAEFHQFRIHPEPNPVHLGIINLRGNILPVLSLGSRSGGQKKQPKYYVVLRTSEDMRFVVPVDSIRKVSLDLEKKCEANQMIEIDGSAAEVMTVEELLKLAGSSK